MNAQPMASGVDVMIGRVCQHSDAKHTDSPERRAFGSVRTFNAQEKIEATGNAGSGPIGYKTPLKTRRVRIPPLPLASRLCPLRLGVK